MDDLVKFLNSKIMDCEGVFENANTNSDINFIFMQGLLAHGGELNALLMNIGKRQAYGEVLDFMRSNGLLEKYKDTEKQDMEDDEK
jgi:hypothetical protein